MAHKKVKLFSYCGRIILKISKLTYYFFIIFLLSSCSSVTENKNNDQFYKPDIRIVSEKELKLIADLVYQDNLSSRKDLIHWYDGENFASLGIAGFTWYPQGTKANFGNTFPELLNYLDRRGITLPEGFKNQDYSPWHNKEDMNNYKFTKQGKELELFLYKTRLLQAEFMVDRVRRALPKLVESAPVEVRPLVTNNLNAIANTPGGWYALIDYINFKGEGLNRSGGYKGQNWGVLQVLEEMKPSSPGLQALNEFADSAMRVLERRVRNSPPEHNEIRWLAGWNRRVNTYRQIPSNAVKIMKTGWVDEFGTYTGGILGKAELTHPTQKRSRFNTILTHHIKYITSTKKINDSYGAFTYVIFPRKIDFNENSLLAGKYRHVLSKLHEHHGHAVSSPKSTNNKSIHVFLLPALNENFDSIKDYNFELSREIIDDLLKELRASNNNIFADKLAYNEGPFLITSLTPLNLNPETIIYADMSSMPKEGIAQIIHSYSKNISSKNIVEMDIKDIEKIKASILSILVNTNADIESIIIKSAQAAQ